VNHAAKGERFRLYYDNTDTDAYSEASADSYGYETFVLAEPDSFTAPEVSRDFVTYRQWQGRMYKYIS
jgi:hypothetical protein